MECENRNHFCYVCGLYSPQKNSRNITRSIVQAFEDYFVMAYVPNLWYVPEVVCDYCYRNLHGWKNKTHKMKYIQPIIWLPRTEHSTEMCYFCLSYEKCYGFQYHNREQILYADVESIIPAKERSAENRTAPCEDICDAEEADVSEQTPSTSASVSSESEFISTASELGYRIPHFITQGDFNDIIRDGNLSKATAELIGSRLKEWNLVASDFKITSARKRENAVKFDECFALHEDSGIVYCKNVNELFKQIGHTYVADEWRLFVDSSATSLKGVLLNIGNKYPSVPIIYATNVAENYENMKLILQLIDYSQHEWLICCDLKVIALLTGLKKGYAKHQCFLCFWEGRRKELHYTDFKWQSRINFQIGQNSIDNIPLIPSSKIILPPLHIKLGVIRSFVRALDHNGEAFKMLQTIFPKLSSAKIEAGKQHFTLFNNFSYFIYFIVIIYIYIYIYHFLSFRCIQWPAN